MHHMIQITEFLIKKRHDVALKICSDMKKAYQNMHMK